MKIGLLRATAMTVPAVALAMYLPFAGESWHEKAAAISLPRTVAVAPGALDYQLPGEFLTGQRPVDAPMKQLRFRRSFDIMAYQVSVAEYARCVDEGACKPADGAGNKADELPVTGINFRDATDYAKWLTERTGETWRLPTDEEWTFAAAERFSSDALGLGADSNPSVRWLARYRSEAEAAVGSDPKPKPRGFFGANSNGVHDLAGNVWEWTTTCYRRAALDETGARTTSTDNCGVRVVGGRHRGYMSFFIRDGKSGGCAAGLPPENLGIRLVKERASLMTALKTFWLG